MAIRERRMWTQARLAEEAGVSPTTVSGIESGRISRPHFGTLRKLARALGVEPQALLSAPDVVGDDAPSDLSLEWAMSSSEAEFERGLEGASIEGAQLALGRARRGGEPSAAALRGGPRQRAAAAHNEHDPSGGGQLGVGGGLDSDS